LFAKLLLNELDLDMPTCATSCQIQHGVLKITIRRVMIWRPFFFINPLSFTLPRFFACPHLSSQTPYWQALRRHLSLFIRLFQRFIVNDIEMDQYLQSQGTSEYKLYDRKFK